MRRLIVATAIWMGFTGMPIAQAQESPTLTPYTATYSVSRGRMTLGRMQVSLVRGERDSWLYQSYTRTTGVASLIRDVRVHETTRFTTPSGHLIPHQHVYTLTGDRRDRNFALVFDWVGREVRGIVEGKDASAEIGPGTVDRHTLGLATVLDVLWERPFPRTRVVVDRARVRELAMRIDGEENVRTPAGTFRALRIVQQRVDDPDKRFVMHLALDANLLPLRVQSQDDDGATVTLELLEFSFN